MGSLGGNKNRNKTTRRLLQRVVQLVTFNHHRKSTIPGREISPQDNHAHPRSTDVDPSIRTMPALYALGVWKDSTCITSRRGKPAHQRFMYYLQPRSLNIFLKQRFTYFARSGEFLPTERLEMEFSTIPRKLWEHPDPKSTTMWRFRQDVNSHNGLDLKVRTQHLQDKPNTHLLPQPQTFQDLHSWLVAYIT